MPTLTLTAPGSLGDISTMCAKSPLAPTCRSFASRYADSLNVKDFGAKLDGSNDAPSFSQARARAKSGQRIKVPPGTFAPTGDITGGPDHVVRDLDGTVTYADGTTPVTNIGTDLTRSILYGNSDFWSRADSEEKKPPLVRVDHGFNYVGGTPELVHNAAQFNCNVNGNNTQAAFESYVWCPQSVVIANDMGPGQHVAVNGTVYRRKAPPGVEAVV